MSEKIRDDNRLMTIVLNLQVIYHTLKTIMIGMMAIGLITIVTCIA